MRISFMYILDLDLIGNLQDKLNHNIIIIHKNNNGIKTTFNKRMDIDYIKLYKKNYFYMIYNI